MINTKHKETSFQSDLSLLERISLGSYLYQYETVAVQAIDTPESFITSSKF
jgi:hypothetical protein